MAVAHGVIIAWTIFVTIETTTITVRTFFVTVRTFFVAINCDSNACDFYKKDWFFADFLLKKVFFFDENCRFFVILWQKKY